MTTDVNRAFWDERVAIHTASDFYDVEVFKAGELTLEPVEIDELGDVRDRTLVHLQCHFGLDTLSCWPFLEKAGRRKWRMPEGRPRLPLMYSLRARRP